MKIPRDLSRQITGNSLYTHTISAHLYSIVVVQSIRTRSENNLPTSQSDIDAID